MQLRKRKQSQRAEEVPEEEEEEPFYPLPTIQRPGVQTPQEAGQQQSSSSTRIPLDATTPRGQTHGTGRLSNREPPRPLQRAIPNRMAPPDPIGSNRIQDSAGSSIEQPLPTPVIETRGREVPPTGGSSRVPPIGGSSAPPPISEGAALLSGSHPGLHSDPLLETFTQQQERQNREAHEARLREEQRLKEEQDRQALARRREEQEAEAQRRRARDEALQTEARDATLRDAYIPLQQFARGNPIGWLPQEQLNSEIQMKILESVSNLPTVGTQLERVLAIDRITIGDDRTVYEYTHASVPGQEPHGLQKRTLLAFHQEASNALEGSSVEEIANVIQAFLNQQHFFQNDCCPQRELARTASNILQEALMLAFKALPTEFDRTRFLLTREIRASLTTTQRQLFEPVERIQIREEAPTGSSSGKPSYFLNTMADIPTVTTFVPGKQDYKKVIDFVRECENNNLPLRIQQWPTRLVEAVCTQYRQHHVTPITGPGGFKPGEDKQWIEFTAHQLRVCLEDMRPDGDTRFNREYSLENFFTYLSTKPLRINWANRGHASQHPINQDILPFLLKFSKTCDYMSSIDRPLNWHQHHECRKLFLKNLKNDNVSKEAHAQVLADLQSYFSTNNHQFDEVLKAVADYVISKMKLLNELSVFNSSESDSAKRKEYGDTDRSRDKRNVKPKSDKPHQRADSQANPKPKAICKRCGYNLSRKEGSGVCNRTPSCASDERRNQSPKPWKESEVGKKWAAVGYHFLPKDTSITLANAKDKRRKCICLAHVNDLIAHNELIDFCCVNTIQEANRTSPTLQGHLLLDSGALGSSIMSTAFYNKLCISNIPHDINNNVDYELATALDESVLINKQISFNINVKSERADHSPNGVTIKVTAIVADITVDLILDREIIKKNNLILHFPSHVASGKLLNTLQNLPQIDSPPEEFKPFSPVDLSNDSPLDDQSDGKQRRKASLHAFFSESPKLEVAWVNKFRVNSSIPRRAFKKQQQWLAREQRTARKHMQRAWTGLVELAQKDDLDESGLKKLQSNNYAVYLAHLASNFSRKSAFEREASSLVDIPDNKLEALPAELMSDILDEAEYTKVSIEGPPLLKQKLQELIQEFKDIFKSTVQGKPAQLHPFKLEVDEEKWFTKVNMLNPRSMDSERARELDRMIQILLEHGVIETSDDPYYSHAFLVPKPSGKWRLVLDFKNLNKATTNSYRWPLPDIKEMLNRVGDSKPSFFAVFDLTSGYYQAPISEESRKYTAFTTRSGIYRWKRLPMGLTGAGSYFQHSLATQVLQGLLQHGTELYLDDCMVHASSTEEYLARLRTVFLRFRSSGITLNPEKCKLGLSQVEYVGHTIDDEGLHFTRSKLDSVLNFPRPETKRQVKSFLGLANYFRDHIRNHSTRVHPLQELVQKYDKRHANHKVKWTNRAQAAFEDIRNAIDECPKLWFLDEHSPIFLQTDASDYGIGAYLYQKVTQPDGSVIEHPVNFISKSIVSAHSSWDTPMKEGYAIFYALRKWEYLLRDREFTIETDHENLTRLRDDHLETNKMVRRWFTCFQEFDVRKWVHRQGKDNEVPDTLSRLCPREPVEHIAVSLFHMTGTEVPADKWDIIKQFHSQDAGHGGQHRTIRNLRAKGHDWPNMTKHVRRFIKLCPCCQKMDQMKKVIHSYPFTTSTYGLWDTVSVDYIESLRPDEFGNNMIIVIVDNFSRFVHLTPAKSTRAEGAADALLQFCGAYATPSRFYTDSGTSFKNSIVQGLTTILGADHSFTSAYSKEQNAIVERQNKEVLRHLRNIIFNKRIMSKWSRYLPIVQRIMNTSVNTSTGVAPSDVVFPNGRQLDHSLVSDANPIYMSDYIREMQHAQSAIIAVCENNLRKKDESHMKNASQQEKTVFENGSYVLVEHRLNSLRRGPKSKLLPFLKGPMLVKSHNEKGMYTLQDLVTQRLSEFHVSNLREFLYDERTMTPLQVAVTDIPDEFIVAECLGMKGDVRGPKSNLTFKVRWAGYGPEDDTEEPWKHVRDTDAVLTYLYNHPNKRVRRLVPKDFIPPDQRPAEEEDEAP